MSAKRIVLNYALAASLLAASATVAADTADYDVVRVSDFGFDEEDSTQFLQSAIDSGARIVVVDARRWVTLPLRGRSNQGLIFEEGAVIEAKRGAFESLGATLLSYVAASNVAIHGKGTLRMWRDDYDKPPYSRSEWRHGISLRGCHGVIVEDIHIVETGGDGIYIGTAGQGAAGEPCRNVIIRGVVCNANYRQGISVISAEGLLIEGCVLSNTKGTPPEAGIDFEPNFPNDRLVDCVMRECIVTNNVGSGCEVVVCASDATTRPLSIQLDGCIFEGNLVGFKYLEGNKDFLKPCETGELSIRSCGFSKTRGNAVWIRRKPFSHGRIVLDDCRIDNCCTESLDAPDVVAFATGHAQYPPDILSFRNVYIHQRAEKDWLSPSYIEEYAGEPTHIEGEVMVTDATGTSSKYVLDEEWRRSRYPRRSDFFDSGLEKPVFDPNGAMVVDCCPGKSVKLSEMPVRAGGRYVFYASEPGQVAFSGAQKRMASRLPASGKFLRVLELDVEAEIARVEMPASFSSKQFAVEVPKAGFYRLVADAAQGNGFCISMSSVPIAVDVREKAQHFVDAQGSLWAWLPENRRMRIEGIGEGLENFASDIFNPSGEKTESKPSNFDSLRFTTSADAESGLWRIDISQPSHGVIEDCNLGLSGVVGFYFLTPEKYWKTK